MRQFLILLVVLIVGTTCLWYFEEERRDSIDDVDGIQMPRLDKPVAEVSHIEEQAMPSTGSEGGDTRRRGGRA